MNAERAWLKLMAKLIKLLKVENVDNLLMAVMIENMHMTDKLNLI